MQLIKPVEAEELAALEARWGCVAQRHHRLEVDHPFLTGEHQRLVSDGRRAEICYVMHQGDPAQGVLLQIKTYYPAGAFRLPTGGIHQGEGVWATLGREVEEETGLVVGEGVDQVQVQRFLGVVSYELAHRGLGRTFEFATYCFLVQMPVGAEINPRDESEQIGGWQWLPSTSLNQVAEGLERIGQRQPTVAPNQIDDKLETIGSLPLAWSDWGRYRSLVHRFVAEILA